MRDLQAYVVGDCISESNSPYQVSNSILISNYLKRVSNFEPNV
jgi:hypothetical protein